MSIGALIAIIAASVGALSGAVVYIYKQRELDRKFFYNIGAMINSF